MKTLCTILISLTSFGASAGGASLGKEDVIFSMMIVGFLILLLGLVYLSDFITKIRKDKDYRDHLRTRVVHLISKFRTIFQKRKESEDEKRIDFAVSLAR